MYVKKNIYSYKIKINRYSLTKYVCVLSYLRSYIYDLRRILKAIGTYLLIKNGYYAIHYNG